MSTVEEIRVETFPPIGGNWWLSKKKKKLFLFTIFFVTKLCFFIVIR